MTWEESWSFKIYDVTAAGAHIVTKHVLPKQIVTKHVLPNISRSEGNQTIKLGQLIEYSIRNIFLEYHTQNVVEKLVPDSFLKNQNILKLRYRPLAFTSYKAFLKNKKRSGTNLS